MDIDTSEFVLTSTPGVKILMLKRWALMGETARTGRRNSSRRRATLAT